jgi:hypothetical protein
MTLKSETSPATLPPPERIRVIRRSSRALVFGVLGLVPVLGWFPAIYTIGMHRQLCRTTGEPWKGMWFSCWLGGLAVLSGILVGVGQWAIGVLGFFLVCGAQVWPVATYLRKQQASYWNPGRHALFYGMSLAWCGLFFSFWMMAIFLGAIIRQH